MQRSRRRVIGLFLLSTLTAALAFAAWVQEAQAPATSESRPALWALTEAGVYRVDAASGAVLGHWLPDTAAEAMAVDAARGLVWLRTARGLEARSFAGERLASTARLRLPGERVELAVRAADGSLAWAEGRRLTLLGPAGQSFAERLQSETLVRLVVDAARDRLFWVGPRTVTELDPVSGVVLGALPLPQAAELGDAALEPATGALWVATSAGIYRVGWGGEAERVSPARVVGLVPPGAGGAWALAAGKVVPLGAAGLGEPLARVAEAAGPVRQLLLEPVRGDAWAVGERRALRLSPDGTVADGLAFPGQPRLFALVAEQAAAFGGWGPPPPAGPQIHFAAPAGFLLVNPDALELVADFTAGAAPLAPATFEISFDGLDVSSSCEVVATGATCSLVAPANGPHEVHASIADIAGQRAETTRSLHALVGHGHHEVALPAAADSVLPWALPHWAFGDLPFLQLRSVIPTRPLVRFELAEVAPWIETLEAAELALFVTENSGNWGPAGGVVKLHRLNTAWSEGAATWSCPEDTNLANFRADCPHPWSGGAYVATATASLTHTDGATGRVAFPVGPDVAAFLAGTAPNHGWLLRRPGIWPPGAVQYGAREGDLAAAPRLVLRFVGGEDPPPPPPDDPTLPPDPGAVAPALDRTVATDVFTATEFLYTGPNPIQTGVAPGTIEPRRVAVLRGKVFDRTGAPLPGVRMTVLGAPEYGETSSRADGVFDLVVNGGGPLTLRYEKAGYLEAQRQVAAPWRDWAWADDVVLVPYDPAATLVASGATTVQVARGTPQTDADGTRRATLLFPPGTTAEMELPDGSFEPLQSLTVRATEYTVGDRGDEAMPGPLPPTVGYTYCVELSADEAEAAGAHQVVFSQPISFYVENFIGFPVGERVPLGWWERREGRWIGATNGRVIEVLGVDGSGLAQLDVDGSGSPASESALSDLLFTDEERATLAGLYPAGTSLWRSRIAHMTPWDHNWPVKPPDDAEPPPDEEPFFDPDDAGDPSDPDSPDHPDNPDDGEDPDDPDNPGDPEDAEEDEPPLEDPCEEEGSVLECENQVLGESLGMAGVPYGLHYRSDRQVGHGASFSLGLAVSGGTVPASLRGIKLRVEVGGAVVVDRSFPPVANQRLSFKWDGQDAYRRTVQGQIPVTVEKTYLYDLLYAPSAAQAQSWARLPEGTFDLPRARATGELALSRVYSGTLEQNGKTHLGTWDAREQGLGGWSLSVHHVYDPNARVLYPGNGGRRSARAIGPVISNWAGSGVGGYAGDGGPAPLARLSTPAGVAFQADGSLLVADSENHAIRLVTASGLIETVAGTGEPCVDEGECDPDSEEPCGPGGPSGLAGAGLCGDGGPAAGATLNQPQDVAVEADGSLLIADTGASCVRRVDRAGVIRTVAGICQPVGGGNEGIAGRSRTFAPALDFGDDGLPAVEVSIFDVSDVEPAPGGGFYLLDPSLARVGYVGTDGFFSTAAGGGEQELAPGRLARAVNLDGLSGIAAAADGSLFVAIAQPERHQIWRIGIDARLSLVAGAGPPGFGGDGRLATSALLAFPTRMVARPDGSLYFIDSGNLRVRKVDPSGVILTVAGNGQDDVSAAGAPASGSPLKAPAGLAVAPDGELYFADAGQHRVLRAGYALTGFASGEIAIASQDGGELYVFDAAGRHLRTMHTLTGAAVHRFTYTANGRVSAISDRNDRVTRIHRDGEGNPTAIEGPYGQVTQMVLGANGYLERMIDQLGGVQQLAHEQGLLRAKTDPRGNRTEWDFTDGGRLARERSPDGSLQEFRRFGPPGSREWTVQRKDGEGIPTLYRSWRHRSGFAERVVSDRGFRAQRAYSRSNGLKTFERANGTFTQESHGPDPRFGMQVAVPRSQVIRLPSGLTIRSSSTAEAVLSDPNDPLSLESLRQTSTINGRTTTSVYDGSSRTFTITSPAGRVSTVRLDERGRLLERGMAGLAPRRFEYLADGRLARVHQGVDDELRGVDFEYDALGRAQVLRGSGAEAVTLVRDAANRLTGQRLVDETEIRLVRDPAGAVTEVHPPGRPPHTLVRSQRGQLSSYGPPGGAATSFTYAANQLPATIERAGGEVVSFTYDNRGRPVAVRSGRGRATLAYGPRSGKLETATTPEGEVLTLGWDGDVQLRQQWSGTVSGTVEQAFNADLALVRQTVQGTAVTFDYDPDGLLTRAGALTLTRDPANGLLRATEVGGLATEQEYNSVGETTALRAAGLDTEFYHAEFSRSAAGRVNGKVETVQGETHTFAYTYDGRGRLVGVARDGLPFETYTYDANNNRLSFSGPAGAGSATFDDQDRLLTHGPLAFTYTAAGEISQKQQGSAAVSFQYDAFNNLMGVTLANGTRVDYVVDAQNRRIGKKIAGTLVQAFLYAGKLSPVAELDGVGNVVSRFVFGSRLNVPDVMERGGRTYRLVTDNLGSVRLVVDVASGEVAQRLDYDAFGRVLLDTNPGFQPFGFAGGIYDHQTGLVRFGWRDYDAETGRWTTKDPILFKGGTTNLYSYVGNDPVNLIDPWGLEPLSECAQEVLAPYFPDVDLSEVELEEGLPLMVKIFAAIDPAFFTSDGNTIHYSPGFLEQDSAKGLAVLGHELEHVRQYRAAGGKWAFRRSYFRDYRQLQKAGYSDVEAYELNAYEVEAHDIEDRILKDLKERFPGGGICNCFQ